MRMRGGSDGEAQLSIHFNGMGREEDFHLTVMGVEWE